MSTPETPRSRGSSGENKLDMSPNVIAQRDDLVQFDVKLGIGLEELADKARQAIRTIGNGRIVFNVVGYKVLGRRLRRLLLIDQQFIEGEDVVLVARAAGIGGVDDVNMVGSSIRTPTFAPLRIDQDR